MKKLLKWLLGFVVTVVLLIVIAIVVLPLVIDPNDYKDRIEQLVTDNTGRSFKIEGDIAWSVFPRLAFSTGAIELGNAQGFEEPFFLRAEAASAGIQVLPLITGRVEAGKVSIDGTDIRLEVNPQGQDNWSDLAQNSEPANSDENSDESSSTPELSVAGFALNNSSVSYKDQVSDLVARLDEINFETGAVTNNKPLDANFSFKLNLDELALKLTADGTLQAQNLLNDSAPAVTLSKLGIEGDYQSLPLSIKTQQPINVDLDTGVLSESSLSVKAGDATLIVDVAATGLNDQPRFNGKLDLTVSKLKQLLKQLGTEIQTTDEQALGSASIKAQWNYANNDMAINNLNMQLDDTQIEGAFSRTAQGIRFQLAVDQINIDRYLPPASETTEPTAATDTPESLEIEAIQGEITIKQLTASGANLSNLRVGVNSDGKQLRLTPIESDLYQGQLKGSANMRTGSRPLKLNAQIALSDIQADPLLTDFAGTAYMSGQGQLNLDISLDDVLSAAPLEGLNGSLGLSFTDGAIYGVNVVNILRKAAVLLGKAEPDTDTTEAATDFSNLDIQAVFNAGVMQTEVFDLKSPYLRAEGEGTINLVESSLNYTLTPVLVDTPEGQAGAGLDELEGVPLPIKLSGLLTEPNISFDVKTALVKSQGSKLENKLLEKLGVNPEESEDEDSGKTLLKGLLNSRKKKKDDDSGND